MPEHGDRQLGANGRGRSRAAGSGDDAPPSSTSSTVPSSSPAICRPGIDRDEDDVVLRPGGHECGRGGSEDVLAPLRPLVACHETREPHDARAPRAPPRRRR